ncbi:Probable Rho GTPase-activating protein CG5521 [Eumeta japonica]|uniref:Probable Rho GTPase-activating protein CG5521 n=1 Tax=Eumeta variegata TaxID=151549 RepID=A0A4C1TRR8_EUMVA|nr:Probable Rho GTPase-activating protein CG5521 [Eumeta japonica]
MVTDLLVIFADDESDSDDDDDDYDKDDDEDDETIEPTPGTGSASAGFDIMEGISILPEHVLNIVVRVCRREGSAAARCAGACALAAHIAHVLATRAHCPRLPSYVSCLLQMLMVKNKNIAKVVSDAILMLADYTDQIVELYPGLAGKIIKWICACLAELSSSSGRDTVKPLAGSLLLCLAEYAVRCGPTLLMQEMDGNQSLLLMIFKVNEMQL